MLKAYKFRLYPNKITANKLQWVLDRCRELYNAALQERKEAYTYARKSMSYVEQSRSLTEIKAEDRREYQEIGSHVLQNALKRVDLAFQAFFRRIKAGETPGYPRFQGRNRYDSFCYPDHAGWKLDNKTLHLTKIGDLKVKLHRPVEGKMKTCTIKREGEHWYVIFGREEITAIAASFSTQEMRFSSASKSRQASCPCSQESAQSTQRVLAQRISQAGQPLSGHRV